MKTIKVNETQLESMRALGIRFEEVTEDRKVVAYAKHKKSGFVVKFFSECEGEVVVGNGCWLVGDQSDEFISYKNSQWELLTYEETNELLTTDNIEPTYTYPLYKKDVKSNLIVKFDGLTSGIVMRGVKHRWRTDESHTNWVTHTDTSHWAPIKYNETLGIFDKQLCECWDNHMTHSRAIRFYSVEKGGAYTPDGKNIYGSKYHNMKPIPFDQYPEWALEAEKTLEN